VAALSAILLDAGGVLIFPEHDRFLPLLRAAGFDPDLRTLERAHYLAMAVQDAADLVPTQANWWRDYLMIYLGACGVPEDRRAALATEVDEGLRGHGWVHVGVGAVGGLRALAALGLPMAVVSNSNGTVEGDLRRLGVCYAPKPQNPEDPADAGAPSHRLLLRAGYIRQLMAGHYSLLPLGQRVRLKVIGIIRE